MLACFVCDQTTENKCRRCRVGICSKSCGNEGWNDTHPHRLFCADISLAINGYTRSVYNACDRKSALVRASTINQIDTEDDVVMESLRTYQEEECRRFGNEGCPSENNEILDREEVNNGDIMLDVGIAPNNDTNPETKAVSDIVKNAKRLMAWFDEYSIPFDTFASSNLVVLKNESKLLIPRCRKLALGLSNMSVGMDFDDFVCNVMAPVIHSFDPYDRACIVTATVFRGRIVVRYDDCIMDQIQARLDATDSIWNMRFNALFSVNIEQAKVIFEGTDVSFSFLAEFHAHGVRQFSFVRTRIPDENGVRPRRLVGTFVLSVDDLSVLDAIANWFERVERVDLSHVMNGSIKDACGDQLFEAIDDLLGEKEREIYHPLSNAISLCPPAIAGGWDFIERLVESIVFRRRNTSRHYWPTISGLTIFDASYGRHCGDSEFMIASLMSLEEGMFDDGDRELVETLTVVGNESDGLVAEQLLCVFSPRKLVMPAPVGAGCTALPNFDFGNLVVLDILMDEKTVMTTKTLLWCALIFDSMRGRNLLLQKLGLPACWRPEHWTTVGTMKTLRRLSIGVASTPPRTVDVVSLENVDIGYCNSINGMLSVLPRSVKVVRVAGVWNNKTCCCESTYTRTRHIYITFCTRDRHRMEEDAFRMYMDSCCEDAGRDVAIQTTTTTTTTTTAVIPRQTDTPHVLLSSLLEILEQFHFLDTLSLTYEKGTDVMYYDPRIAVLASTISRVDRLPSTVVVRGNMMSILSHAPLYLSMCKKGGKVILECDATTGSVQCGVMSVTSALQIVKACVWKVEKMERCHASRLKLSCDDCGSAMDLIASALCTTYVGSLEILKIVHPSRGIRTNGWCRDAALLSLFIIMGRLPTEKRIRVSIDGIKSHDAYHIIGNACGSDTEMWNEYEKLWWHLVAGPIPTSSENDGFEEGRMVVLKTRLEVSPLYDMNTKFAPDAYPNSTTVRWFARMKHVEGIDITAQVYTCEFSDSGINIGGSSMCVPGVPVPGISVRLETESHIWELESGNREILIPQRWEKVKCRWEAFKGKPIWRRLMNKL